MESFSVELDKPWTITAEDVVERMKVAPDRGLDDSEVQRKAAHRVRPQSPSRNIAKKHLAHSLSNSFRSVIVLLLGGAAAASFAFGHWMEGDAIVAVLLLNGAIGFFTELAAVRSMEALAAAERRHGHRPAQWKEPDRPRTETSSPGDVVLMEGGDVVTADLRLVNGSRLQADESRPSRASPSRWRKRWRKTSPPSANGPPGGAKVHALRGNRHHPRIRGRSCRRHGNEDRIGSHLFSGCRWGGRRDAPSGAWDRLGKSLVWLTLAVAALIAVAGIVAGRPLFFMVQTAVALAVAAIPEGLPIVATAACTRGACGGCPAATHWSIA